MNVKAIITSLFVVGILASCAPSITVKYDYDPKVNVRQFSTYRIEADRQRNADPIVGSNLNQRRISDALDQSLKARGYKPVTQGEADLVVRFFTDARDRQQIQSNNTMSPWGWGWGGWGMPNQVYSRNYEENRVVINVIDARTNDIVWQGWATGQLNNRNKERDRDQAFRETVTSIMKNFPESAGQDYGAAR
ncbi:DUF4136 domain-containing protein [Spirosoma montaniterrae]|uniref:DUF4136 domain-containing protein n=1 Tax=Spirosoma montaniterrae TaxID=1178516 RepID=A0A1P9WZN0_9BACT|nr:DUF4136 domain-containing protein [Spirosoma montaniterrae]AQG80823.1 hypothetical protein AWR27_16765 [Spirosoma montaniterrae]